MELPSASLHRVCGGCPSRGPLPADARGQGEHPGALHFARGELEIEIEEAPWFTAVS